MKPKWIELTAALLADPAEQWERVRLNHWTEAEKAELMQRVEAHWPGTFYALPGECPRWKVIVVLRDELMALAEVMYRSSAPRIP